MTEHERKDPPPPPPSSPPAPEVWLPPKLREKLEGTGRGDGPRLQSSATRSSSRKPLALTGAIAVVAVGGFLGWRSSAQGPESEAPAAMLPVVAPIDTPWADSSAIDSLLDSMRIAPSAGPPTPAPAAVAAGAGEPSQPSAARAPRRSTPPPGSGSMPATAAQTPPPGSGADRGAASATGTPPSAGSGFGILAGSYLMEDRAHAERQRLSDATGLAGSVRPTTEAGGVKYDVVLGRFGSRAEAERRAATLVEEGKLNQAQIVSR